MSKDYTHADRYYRRMVEILNLPRTIDVMRMMPAYVKSGMVYDFNDKEMFDTDRPDGDIFKGIERVKKTQAVTAALKRDYTTALNAWTEGDKVTADENGSVAPSKAKKAAAKDATAEKKAKVAKEAAEFDLVKSVKKLLKSDDAKGAKKLLKANKEDADYKKAKKLYKTATED